MIYCNAEHWVAHSRILGEDIYRDCCRLDGHDGDHRDEYGQVWSDEHKQVTA